MSAITCDLSPVLRQYSRALKPASLPLKGTRGRFDVGATLQRRCNGARGRSVAAKSLQLLALSSLQRLQRCNGLVSRVCGCDATRCGHTYARDGRCAVAVLQSSIKVEISMVWAATAFATVAARAVAAPMLGLSAWIDAARSIKYPRISAGAGRRLRIGPIWGVGCACAGPLAAPIGGQALAGSAITDQACEVERNQGLSARRMPQVDHCAVDRREKAQRAQVLSLIERLTDRVKRPVFALGNPPPRSAAAPTPRPTARPSSIARFAAPVGSDPKGTLQGVASIGIDRVGRGPGRAGPRGTGLQVAGSREGAHG